MPEWFAPVLGSHDTANFPPGEWLIVFRSMQARDVKRLKIRQQDSIQVPCLYITKLVVPCPDKTDWTFQHAVEQCEAALRSQFTRLASEPTGAMHSLCLNALECFEGTQLALLCRTPNGLLAQPICVPAKTVSEKIAASKKCLSTFMILRAAGMQCIDTRFFDQQPMDFQEWFGGVLMGKIEPPGARPKSWSLLERDNLIFQLVETLKDHGFSVFRNDVSPRTSALDVLVDAAKAAGLRSPQSYDAVKKIYTSVRRQKRG